MQIQVANYGDRAGEILELEHADDMTLDHCVLDVLPIAVCSQRRWLQACAHG